LLACLGGLEEPDGGAVFVDGSRLSHRPERVKAQMRARHFGIVMQSGNLVEHLTVRQNAALSLRLSGKRDNGRVDAILERLGIAARSGAAPSELSGGEAVRAAVAAAVAGEPSVVLADEPTAEVDAAAEAGIAALLRDVAAGGAAVVVATHSTRLAEHADSVVRLLDGSIVGAA
jgi:putative ABC transport system ATP-binding protein